MLKHDLDYNSYKLQIVQRLKETDFVRWKDFRKQFLHSQLLENLEFFSSNEAPLKLNGSVNK